MFKLLVYFMRVLSRYTFHFSIAKLHDFLIAQYYILLAYSSNRLLTK